MNERVIGIIYWEPVEEIKASIPVYKINNIHTICYDDVKNFDNDNANNRM